MDPPFRFAQDAPDQAACSGVALAWACDETGEECLPKDKGGAGRLHGRCLSYSSREGLNKACHAAREAVPPSESASSLDKTPRPSPP